MTAAVVENKSSLSPVEVIVATASVEAAVVAATSPAVAAQGMVVQFGCPGN